MADQAVSKCTCFALETRQRLHALLLIQPWPVHQANRCTGSVRLPGGLRAVQVQQGGEVQGRLSDDLIDPPSLRSRRNRRRREPTLVAAFLSLAISSGCGVGVRESTIVVTTAGVLIGRGTLLREKVAACETMQTAGHTSELRGVQAVCC